MPDIYGRASTTAFTVASGSVTKITGLSLEKIVPTGAPSPWNNGSSRFEVITGAAGTYIIIARAQWTTTFSGSVLLQARINGSTVVNLCQHDNSTATSGAVLSGTATVDLAEGDYVDLRVRQVSGSNKDISVEEFTFAWTRA